MGGYLIVCLLDFVLEFLDDFYSQLGSMTRKPNGDGRLSNLRRRRSKIAEVVAALLLGRLDLDLVESTGALFPRKCNLRKKAVKKFLFLKKIPGRVYTTRVCKAITRQVVLGLPFQLPVDPRKGLKGHIAAQAELLKKLAKRCKRASTMEPDTLPWV